MATTIAAVPAKAPMSALRAALQVDPAAGPQQLFPVIDSDRRLLAVVTRFTLQQLTERQTVDAVVNLDPIRHNAPAVAYPDEPLRAVVQRVAETGFTRFPVVDRDPPNRVVGIISLDNLLKARALNLEAERRRERIIRMDLSFRFKFRRARETV